MTKKKVHPTIDDYVEKNLKDRGYKMSQALTTFHNQLCRKDPERHKELLLRKKKLERGLKILNEELQEVNNELELENKEFKIFDIKDTDDYKLALDEVFKEITKIRIMVEDHNKYGYKLKKDKIKEICMKHNIDPKLIISEVKKQSPEAVRKYIEKI